MRDRLAVAVLLCDQIYRDRGKVSLLGLQWSLLEPGQRALEVAVVISVQDPTLGDNVDLAITLRRLDDPKSHLLRGRITGEPTERDNGVEEPHGQAVVPLSLPAIEFEPNTDYVIEVHHEKDVVASATFRTKDSVVDDDGGTDASDSEAE